MGERKFSNNASTTLIGNITNAQTTITVASSSGFPSVTTASGNYFNVCMYEVSGAAEINMEIVKVTDVTGTTWTVERAQEGSVGYSRTGVTTYVELRLTAAGAQEFVQKANNLSDVASAATARTNLGLAIGTNVQAYDAGLQSISGLTTAANKMIYTTASDTYATTDLSVFARTILDDADAATVRGTIGAGTGNGDVAGQASSVDSEIALFSGTDGKTIKRATTSGILKATSGVIGSAVENTDYVSPNGTATLNNKTLNSPRVGTAILDTNGNELIAVTATASAINEITVTNAATTGSPAISATGGDANISLNLVSKGTGTVQANGVSLLNTTVAASTYAPIGATYIVQTAHGSLTGEQALSALTTGIVKNTTGTGVLSIAVAGTDYLAPPTGTALLKANSGGALANATAGTDYSAGTSALGTGILKSTTGTGALSIAVAGTDYQTAQSVTGIVKSTGVTRSAAVAGTDYMAPASTINIGTTNFALNRASGAQTLTGVSVDGDAGSVDGKSFGTFTAAGGILYATSTTAASGTAAGASGQFLKSAGAGAPTWGTLTMEDIPGASYKASCGCATTAALTINTAQATIDGVTLSAGTRVLVKNQATASQNGIYTDVTTTSWTRATDSDSSAEIAAALVNIDGGTTNGGKLFTNTFKTTDTLGTTAMNWYEIADTSSTQTFTGKTIVAASNTITTAASGNLTSTSLNAALAELQSDIDTRLTSSTAATTYAPIGAKYIVQTADASLTGEQALGALATGLVKNTTTTGVLSIAVAGTDYVAPGTATNFTAVQRPDYTTTAISTTSSYNFAGADQVVNITLTNAITVTFGAPSGLVTGAYYTFILTAGDASARTFGWNTAWKFPGAAPKLAAGSATSGGVDVITFLALSATTAAYVGHTADCR